MPCRERIVVAEAVARADHPVRVAEVVLEQRAVGVVVDQVLVDVDDMVRAQQIAHLLVVASVVQPHLGTIAERQAAIDLRREKRAQGRVPAPLDPVLQRIDRMPARHPVLADQLVPVDLRIVRVVGEPRRLGRPVARITRKVAVVVRHRRPGVVPPQRAVPVLPRGGAQRQVQRRRRRKRPLPRRHGQRKRLAADPRIANPAALETPRRVIEPVAGEREGLLRGRQAHPLHRNGHDAEQRQRIASVEGARKTEARRHGIREDPLDVQVAARPEVGTRRKAPAPGKAHRARNPRAEAIIAVGETHRDQVRLQRLPVRKAEKGPAARTRKHARARLETRVAVLLGAEQAQKREVTVGEADARKGVALGGVVQTPAAERDRRQRKIRITAVEILGALNRPVEERRVGGQQRTTLLTLRIRVVVFIVGTGLGRGREDRQRVDTHGRQQAEENPGDMPKGLLHRLDCRSRSPGPALSRLLA